MAAIVVIGWFNINLWAALMPQFWGQFPIHTPINYASVYCLVLSVVTATVGALGIRKLFLTSWKGSSIAASLFVVVLFFLTKIIVFQVEKQSVLEGNQLNTFIKLRYLECGQFPTNEEVLAEHPMLDRSFFKIHFDSESKQWTLAKRSRFLWWWEINYSSQDGWFYLID